MLSYLTASLGGQNQIVMNNSSSTSNSITSFWSEFKANNPWHFGNGTIDSCARYNTRSFDNLGIVISWSSKSSVIEITKLKTWKWFDRSYACALYNQLTSHRIGTSCDSSNISETIGIFAAFSLEFLPTCSNIICMSGINSSFNQFSTQWLIDAFSLSSLQACIGIAWTPFGPDISLFWRKMLF